MSSSGLASRSTPDIHNTRFSRRGFSLRRLRLRSLSFGWYWDTGQRLRDIITHTESHHVADSASYNEMNVQLFKIFWRIAIQPALILSSGALLYEADKNFRNVTMKAAQRITR